jgi:hypothetical protein
MVDRRACVYLCVRRFAHLNDCSSPAKVVHPVKIVRWGMIGCVIEQSLAEFHASESAQHAPH